MIYVQTAQQDLLNKAALDVLLFRLTIHDP